MKKAYYFTVEDDDEPLEFELVEKWVKQHYPCSDVKVVELE